VSRLVGMIITLAALLALLVGLSWAFYLAAAAVATLFVAAGLPPEFGVAVANLLTLMLVVLMISASLLTVAERKWAALIQNRIGANRIRVFGSALGGIPFLIADALKMLTKEPMRPESASRFLFNIAPVLSFAPVFVLFAIIPVGPALPLRSILDAPGALGQVAVSLQIASPDAGLLYLFALSSLAVYGTSLAGWASNSKLGLLGAVRASSQMISYEVSLGLSLVGTMIAFRTLRLEEMVVQQGQAVLGPVPALGLLLQPIGFLVFFASAFAETKRAPFDLPEGESEIVGYNVEYSGMQWGLMFLAEFVEIVILGAVITAVFLGGWHPIVFEGWLRANLRPLPFAAVCGGAFLAKMIVVMWLQMTIRWLLPRFRYDQIQQLCWKILLPVSIANIFVTGAAVLLDPSLRLLAWLGLAILVILGALVAAAGRAPAPEHDEHAEHAAHAAAGH
jgi:NADH-quinone oxidoreductase subunit H